MHQITVFSKTYFNDRLTPIQAYSNIRRYYTRSFLCESGEYLGDESRYSILGAHSLCSVTPPGSLKDLLSQFSFDTHLPRNGFYGSCNYPDLNPDGSRSLLFEYHLFEFLVIFNHQESSLTVVHNTLVETPSPHDPEGLDTFFQRLLCPPEQENKISFSLVGPERSDSEDQTFIEMVKKLKDHIQRGDIFQVVPSKAFYQGYAGDDFQVYRTLRIVNPSPYLFYFDFGTYRLFGSSPEACLLVSGDVATVNPIAGTCARSGDLEADKARVETLLVDPKEASEHVMLVDLARNDLSRSCYPVTVKKFREVHYYSHVVHLVSAVIGTIPENTPPIDVFLDTFPAGTVSGAPKVMAMDLLSRYEASPRGFYAGSVGMFGTGGDIVQALAIRTFHSKDFVLTYRAGAGEVIDSIPEKELQEVHHKLNALRVSLKKAELLHETDLTA